MFSLLEVFIFCDLFWQLGQILLTVTLFDMPESFHASCTFSGPQKIQIVPLFCCTILHKMSQNLSVDIVEASNLGLCTFKIVREMFGAIPL